MMDKIFLNVVKEFAIVQPNFVNIKGNPRSSHQRCSIKKVFLEISQSLQENTCARVSFNKVAGLR